MGTLIRSFDWAATAIGPPGQWPVSLQTMVSVILHSRFPMFLWWGNELIQFYNDAYRPSLGDSGKHPGALGQRAADCWPEIWPTISPLINEVMAGGESVWSENQLVPIYRNGRLDDVYWTFSYSPVPDEAGHVGGVLVICQETTALVHSLELLARQEADMQHMVKEAPVGIAMLRGPEYTFTLANDAYLTLADRTHPGDLVGKPLLTAMPELKSQGVEALLADSMRSGEPIVTHEQPVPITRNGPARTAYYTTRYKPLYEADGRPAGVLVVGTDVTDTVVARQQIQAQQQRLYTLFEQAPVAIAIVRGPQFVVEFANSTVCQLWGRTAEQVRNRPLFDTLTETAGQGFEERLTGVLHTGNPFVGNELPSLIDRNGRRETVYWNFTYAPLYENGLITGVTIVAADVSEQVAARNAVEHSEQAYRELTDALSERVEQRTRQLKEANAQLEQTNRELSQTADLLQSVLNGVPASITMMEAVRNDDGDAVDFTTSAFNRQALDLTGQSAGDMGRHTLLEAQPELRTNGLFDCYLTVLASGEPAYRELELDRPVPGCYAFFITRQVDTNGVVVTILNITDRKQAEAEVRELADSLQAVLDASPASIGMLKASRNEAGDVVDFILSACNQKFVELAGQSSAELIGSSVTTFADTLWYAETFANLLHVLTTHEPLYEERSDTREGTERWLALSFSKHDDGVVVTGLDITVLRRAEQQQISWLQELERSAEMVQTLVGMREHIRQRGEFLRATSHDLRGSFGVIEGAATLLHMMDTEEERAELLSMLQRNLRQATQMLNQLLDYSRLEAGQEELRTGSFDAARVLRELVAGLQPMAAERTIVLRGVGAETLPVEGDVVKCSRIAQNLVLNALKYTKTGTISVTWESAETADAWRFIVHDSGPGLPPAMLHLLTGTGGDGAGSPPGDTVANRLSASGEGIGLFIVRRLSDLLGGKLTVASSPDSGTRIVVELPGRYENSQPG